MSAAMTMTQTVVLTVGPGLLTARGTPDGGGGWIVDLETLLATLRGSRYSVPRGDASEGLQARIEHADGSPFVVSVAAAGDALSEGGDPVVDTVTPSVTQVPANSAYTTGLLTRGTGRHYLTVTRVSGTAAPTNEIRVQLVFR